MFQAAGRHSRVPHTCMGTGLEKTRCGSHASSAWTRCRRHVHGPALAEARLLHRARRSSKPRGAAQRRHLELLDSPAHALPGPRCRKQIEVPKLEVTSYPSPCRCPTATFIGRGAARRVASAPSGARACSPVAAPQCYESMELRHIIQCLSGAPQARQAMHMRAKPCAPVPRSLC